MTLTSHAFDEFGAVAPPMSSKTTLSLCLPGGCACCGCLGLAYSMLWTSDEKTVSLMTDGLCWRDPLEEAAMGGGMGGGGSVAVGEPRALKLVLVDPFSLE